MTAEPVRWATATLDELDVTVTQSRLQRRRAWSSVWQLMTSAGSLWLKSVPPQLSVEPAVLDVLARHGVPHVQRPIAVSGHFVLLPDGGGTIRELETGRSEAWSQGLVHYAEVQRATTIATEDLLDRGVPDMRLSVLPDAAEALVDRWAPEMRHAVGRVRDAAAELDEIYPVTSIQHDDLHEGNMFSRSAVPFDWGDASVSHPYLSMLVAGRVETSDDVIAAYLGTRDDAENRRAIALGMLLGRVSRAATWARVIDAGGTELPVEMADAPRQWLLSLDETAGGPPGS